MSTLNQYSVEPFSGSAYHKNFKALQSHEYGCAICGKPVVSPYVHEATIVHGGTWAQTQEEADDINDAGYMGVWGIGPNCHKKYLIKTLKKGHP